MSVADFVATNTSAAKSAESDAKALVSKVANSVVLNMDEARATLLDALGVWRADVAMRLRAAQDLNDTLLDRVSLLEGYLGKNSAQPEGAEMGQSVDPITGLPDKAQATAAIRLALQSKEPHFAVCLHLNYMKFINERLSEVVGDRVLLLCGQYIATQLATQTVTLFRWSGPAFIAVIKKGGSPQEIALEIERLVAKPLHKYLQLPDWMAFLHVHLAAQTIPLAGRGYAEAMDEISKFMLRNLPTKD